MRWFIFPAFLFLLNIASAQTGRGDSTRNAKYLFYRDQKIRVQGYFKNRERHRIWTWYREDGTVLKKVKYKKGTVLWSLYYEDNKPWLKINRFGKRRVIRTCKCMEPDY